MRGVANIDLTPELAFALGRAGAAVLGKPGGAIVVGRDTRLSGTMLEAALTAGIASTGCDAISVGVVPTPAVARIVVRTGAAAGVMISASHNPIEDNGIKFFASDGFKLDDATELKIEALVDDGSSIPRPSHAQVGIARTNPEFGELYVDALVAAGHDLSRLVLVVDGAFGAAYRVAPQALAKLGATVVPVHCEDDGARINVRCGSTDPAQLANAVRERAASDANTHVLGVAFDGDADRALFVDETGTVLSGDHVMLVLGREKRSRGALAGDAVVGTVMSNIGLERALAREGIRLLRAAVGDRYVLETMRNGGFTFGGEQSGHIIDLERNTTGDGPMTAVELFSIVARSGARLADLAADLHVAPQILVNVRTSDKSVLERDPVRYAIARAERELGSDGRILVRASGTEPLIRVMIEGDDRARIDRLASELAEIVKNTAQ